jgi:predicted GH43/DUF377 family glycosyl hydrolase
LKGLFLQKKQIKQNVNLRNNKQFIGYIVFGFLFISLFSCKKEFINKSPATLNEPIIKTGDFFAGSNWNDPFVLDVNGKFVMYASASRNFDQNVKIYRMESDDGISWKLNPASAVFEKSFDLNDWDSRSVETPAVVYFNGNYHLFYTGYKTVYSDAGNYKIGHAVSSDGIHWNRDYSFLLKPTHPNAIPNMDFNQYVVGEPAPVVFNNKIYLYFTAVGMDAGLNKTLQVIGVTIYDGNSWSTPVLALKPDQNIYPRSGFVGYSTPNAMVKNNRMHLYFDIVQDPWKQVKIHHAESMDGISGWQTDTTALLNREDYTWTENEILAPSAVYKDSKTYLWFAGNKGTDLGIGLKIIE